MQTTIGEHEAPTDAHDDPLPRYAASAALLGIAALAVCGARGTGRGALLEAAAIALTCAWTGALWLAARRAARRLECLPQPESCPRRRCLHGDGDAHRPGARLDHARAMLGQFRLLPGGLPARRTLDKIRCLQGFARRCRDACVALAAAAIIVLLAS